LVCINFATYICLTINNKDNLNPFVMALVNVYRTSNLSKVAYTAEFITLSDAEAFASQINTNQHLFARVYLA
jgi:hypothetical protein